LAGEFAEVFRQAVAWASGTKNRLRPFTSLFGSRS
jgi:hypothetical protein